MAGQDPTAESASDPATFEITAIHACELRETWVQIVHTPCQEIVFGAPDDAEDLDAAELLTRITAHQCKTCECGCVPGQPCGCGLEDCECAGGCSVCDSDADANRSNQIIDVVVDGEPVTAAVHGSRPLNTAEQAAFSDVVRATARMHREEARQRDEDVRAVGAAIDAIGRFWAGQEPIEALTGPYADLQARFATRIAELRLRDAAQADAFEADLARRETRTAGETPKPEQRACGNCRHPFDPTDRTFDGTAEDPSMPGFCHGCVSDCHEAGPGHRCAVCRSLDRSDR